MSLASGAAPAKAQPPLRVIVVITLALTIAFASLTAPYYLFGGDSARYVALARSLAQGNGYQLFGQPDKVFPPGFPLILVPAALFSADSFATVARWAAMIGALVFPATYAFARRGTAALPIAVLTVCSAGFLELIIGNPRSEPAYMVCSLGLIAWADRGASGPERRGRWPWTVAAGSALLLLTVATRAIGVAAVGAIALVLLERVVRPSHRRAPFPSELLLPLGAGAAFVLAWFAWGRTAANADPDPSATLAYVRQLLLADPHRPDLGVASPIGFAVRILQNLRIEASHAAELLTQLPWLKPRWFSPPAAAALALTVTGWRAELRRPSRVGAWYFLGYWVVLLCWPFDEGTRFLVPILPLLWLYGIEGAGRALAAVAASSRGLRLGVIVVASLGLMGTAIARLALPADFSRQDQVFGLLWLLILGIALFGWARTTAWAGAMSRRSHRTIAIAAIALYVAGGLARTVPGVVVRRPGTPLADPVAESLREASQWISVHTPPEATIQGTFPTQIQFATGRKTVRFPISGSPELLRHSVERYRPDFLIVLHGAQGGYYQPADSVKFTRVQAIFPGVWREAGRLSGSTIYASR